MSKSLFHTFKNCAPTFKIFDLFFNKRIMLSANCGACNSQKNKLFKEKQAEGLVKLQS